MQKKSIGILFKESRIIAKSIDRLELESDRVGFQAWNAEGRLLNSKQGSCLSSSTLLVRGKHVPTYAINSRTYGILFNAENCFIYDVSSTDSNSNRISKLEHRKNRQGIDLLSKNDKGIKTLDDLSREIHSSNANQMNEILLDAHKASCVGLFVRRAKPTNIAGLKLYYQSLLEIRLVQKYLHEAFEFPNLPICIYDERQGKLLKFSSDNELMVMAQSYGLHKDYP